MQPQMGPAWLKFETRRFRWVQVFARLRPGLTARARAGGPAAALSVGSAAGGDRRGVCDGVGGHQEAFPRWPAQGGRRLPRSLEPAVTDHHSRLMILMAIAGAVLLIVCANVANLLIARGAARHRELALRLAVGASRRQIVRLLLVESLVLSIAGAVLGVVLASWGAQLLLGFFITPESPLAVTADPDMRILVFASLLAIVTAMLSGTIPAFRSTHVDLAPTLKGSRRRGRLRAAPLAQDARRRAGGLVVPAADWRRVVPAQPAESDGGGPRLSHRARADLQRQPVPGRLQRRSVARVLASAARRRVAHAGCLLGGLRVPIAAGRRRLGDGLHCRGVPASSRRQCRLDGQRREPRVLHGHGNPAAGRARIRQAR